jgi:hypothetical protein
MSKPSFNRIIRRKPVHRGKEHGFDVEVEPSEDPRLKFVSVDDVWVEVPLGRDWIAAYRLVEQRGYPVVAELRIFPAEKKVWKNKVGSRSAGEWSAEILGRTAKVPRGGITARMVRAVRIGEHHRVASEFISELRGQGGEPNIALDLIQGKAAGRMEVHSTFEIKKTEPRSDVRPRRRLAKGRPEIFYAEMARAYVEELQAGSKRPIVDLAKRLRLDRSKVRDMIYAARRRGLLEGGSQGKKGGKLSDKAKRLLRNTQRKKEDT